MHIVRNARNNYNIVWKSLDEGEAHNIKMLFATGTRLWEPLDDHEGEEAHSNWLLIAISSRPC